MTKEIKRKNVEETIPNKLLGFFWHFIKPSKYKFIFSVLFIVFFRVLDGFLLPFILKDLINIASENSSTLDKLFPLIIVGLILYAFFSCCKPIFIMIAGLLEKQFQPAVIADIDVQMLSHVHSHSYRYFSDNFGGSLSNKISDLSNYLFSILGSIIWHFIPSILILGLNLVLFSLIDNLLGILIFLFIFIHLTYTAFRIPSMRNTSKRHSEEVSVVRGKIVDSLTNFTVVKLSSKQKSEKIKIFNAHEKEKFYHRKYWTEGQKTWIPLGFLSEAFSISLTILIFYLYSKSRINLGEASYAFMVLGTIHKSVWDFNKNIMKFIGDISRMQRALETLLSPIEINDIKGAKNLKVKKGDIKFDNISFHYGNHNNIFKDFSLDIKPGEKVGLVGSSGAGKTTLINLLLRLFDVQKGQVIIDGQDISKVKQKSLRENISVVTQDSTLFHRTLEENIGYTKERATQKEIISASKKADAHNFINELPKKYKTLVGERGIKLSGGQRQRVNIARTILKDAPILILDEATSALDSETEVYIQKTFEKIMKGKTTIAIAHRLSTLKLMDRIVVIDNGKIVEEGTHKQLLSKGGKYAKLWKIQSTDFIADENV